MKTLRILTGRHAGASIELAPGTAQIGPGADCDITISDWTFPPLRLHVDDRGVRAEWTPAPRPTDTQPVTNEVRDLEDFQPREFAGTVVCVGPSHGPWPSDVALLDIVFRPTPQRLARWAGVTLRTRRVATWAGAAALFAALGLSGVWASGLMGPPPEPPAPTLDETRAAVQAALDTALKGQLVVTTDPSGLVVNGLVDGPEQSFTARNLIDAHRAAQPAQLRYAVATDLAEAIRGGVGLPNATVRHQGNGVFSFVAEAADERAARAAIDRVTADLSPAVKRIDATLEQQETMDSTKFLSRLSTDTVQVMQTRDGVKHLVVKSPQPSVSVSDALALSPAAPALFPSNPSTPGVLAIPSKE